MSALAEAIPAPAGAELAGTPNPAIARRVLAGALVTATVGLCAGAAAAEWIPSQPVLLGVAAGLAISGFIFRNSNVLLAAIALAAGQLGAWRMDQALSALAAAGQQVVQLSGSQQIRGLVVDDPVNKGRTTTVRLSNVLVQTSDGWQPLDASVLLSLPAWPEHEFGEYLQVRGRIQPLSGGPAVEALRRQGVLASMSFPKVSYLANPQANPALIAVFRFRKKLAETIDQTLPEPAASMLKATVLGQRSALPKDEQQALVETGTVHLVAISGFKLSLLAAALMALGSWILRRTMARGWGRFAISAAALTALASYTVMTGASPSAVRAAIMAGAVLIAALAGRPREQIAALAIAVFAIVLSRPSELQDGGFQLSCLSVLGIALLAQPLNTRLGRAIARLPRTARAPATVIGQAATVSLAATAFDLPVLAGSFHTVSLVAPLANLLGMPLLGPIMVFGGLGAAAGSLVPAAGAALLWPAWAVVSLLVWVVRMSAALPYAALAIGDLPAQVIVVYYAALLMVSYWLRRARLVTPPKGVTWAKHVSWAAITTGALAIACLSALTTRPPTTLRATFLAVPGQATLIQTPAGSKVLVDGGSDGAALLRQVGSILPPWDRTIDAVIVTSPSTEHLGGLDELFARYHVGAFITPSAVPGSPTLSRLLERVPSTPVDRVDLGGDALLSRTSAGWRLNSGEESILLATNGADVRLQSGEWSINPMLRSSPASDSDHVLSLAETGTVTVTFGT